MRYRWLAANVVAVLVLSSWTSACTVFYEERKVPLSFSVHIISQNGPVAGFQLMVMREQGNELVAEATTDAKGVAHFHLSTGGRFFLDARHWNFAPIRLIVADDNPPATLKFTWPQGKVLESSSLTGRISGGLFYSPARPVSQAALTVHEALSYRELRKAQTAPDGSFAFTHLRPGLYLLEVEPAMQTAGPPTGGILVLIDPNSSRSSLEIAVGETTCGFEYDLQENKAKYRLPGLPGQ